MSLDTIIISRVLDDISHKDFNYLPTIEGSQLDTLDILNYFKNGSIGHSLTETIHKYTNALNGYYLKDFLYKKGISSAVINIFDYELDSLQQMITEEHPLAIVLSTTFILSLPVIKRVIDYIRFIDEKIAIIVGGPCVINTFPDTNENPAALQQLLVKNGIDQIDYIIKEYEGENTLYKMIDHLKNGLPADELPNVASRKNHFVFTPPQAENNGFENYSIHWNIFESNDLTKNIPIQAGKGCHERCKFCSYWKTSGKIIKHKSLDALKKEFRALSQYKHIESIRFVDDDFTVPVKRFQEICKMMIAEKLPWKWSCWVNVTSLTEESVKFMKEAGCDNVLMGIESGSNQILKLMNKNQTVHDILKAIQLLNKYDILSFGYFICGYPGETYRTVDETIDLLNNSGLDSYEVIRFAPYPVLSVYEERAVNGLKGYGSNWRHNTMNSEEALENIKRIVYEAKESAFIPGGMEPIRYLLNNNFLRKEIVEAVKSINSLWRLEIDGNNNGDLKQSYINKIKTLVRKAG
jgi:anaerobic magnesium-protoporphyrin IX monomethyl ester cyclase